MFRRVVFWAHFATGLVFGTIIFALSASGVLLAFEHDIVDFAEAGVLRAGESPASRRSLDDLAATAGASIGAATLTGVSLRADAAAVVFSFGSRGNVLVDHESGEVLGRGAERLRRFFESVTSFHRWLTPSAPRWDPGSTITAASNAGFLFLVVSGPYLWLPRRWGRAPLRAVTVPSFSLRGWRRDWNWHNVLGFWSAPMLAIITSTGLVISYPWANDLVYELAGSTPPPRPSRPAASDAARSAETAAPAPILDGVFTATVERAPDWRKITLRMPRSADGRGTALVEDAASLNPYARSTLTFDPRTGWVEKWEPYAEASLGRRLRSWIRGLHTGEAGHWIGQSIAALASAAAAVLVWTGTALAWRRIAGRRPDSA